jgi:hypothetical protein
VSKLKKGPNDKRAFCESNWDCPMARTEKIVCSVTELPVGRNRLILLCTVSVQEAHYLFGKGLHTMKKWECPMTPLLKTFCRGTVLTDRLKNELILCSVSE